MESTLRGSDIRPAAWVETVGHYDELFTHAVGSPSAMAEVAQRLAVRNLTDTVASRRIFG